MWSLTVARALVAVFLMGVKFAAAAIKFAAAAIKFAAAAIKFAAAAIKYAAAAIKFAAAAKPSSLQPQPKPQVCSQTQCEFPYKTWNVNGT